MAALEEVVELTGHVAEGALAARWRLTTAESCTGGWIAKALTDIAGSSRWFDSGFVTYSNASKIRDLGVSSRTLAVHGAVSEAVVREMAAGALKVTGANLSVAVSGVAGPDGGTAEKPVGTVWFCVGRRPDPLSMPKPDEREDSFILVTEGRLFGGDRETIRRLSVAYALKLMLSAIEAGRSGPAVG
jgi:nicotinamide-nucleotide amidase